MQCFVVKEPGARGLFFCLFAAVAADGGPIINFTLLLSLSRLVSSVTSSTTTTTTRMTTTTRLQNHTRVHTERLSAAVRIDNAGRVSYYWLNQTVWWKHVSLPFCLLYCTALHCTALHCRLYGQLSGVHASWRVAAVDANVHWFTCRFACKNKHSATKRWLLSLLIDSRPRLLSHPIRSNLNYSIDKWCCTRKVPLIADFISISRHLQIID